ncbi:Mss4-like protein [Biscogniauxia marginata]|nr:Mss4-like protein [Biscogniauxia marginata]
MSEQQAPAPAPPLKTYRGNCHCGAYVYEVTIPEITSVGRCRCSICSKSGALWKYVDDFDANLRFVKGDPAALAGYTFGNKNSPYKICPHCGVSFLLTGRFGPSGPEVRGVNIRTFQYGQGVDVWTLDITTGPDASSLPPAYEPAKYTGPEPTADVEGGKLYTGSCHCGAVRVALKSKPLDKTYEGSITECNCSHCSRHAGIWAYPHKDQIAIQGEENLVPYVFGTKAWGKYFCKHCGILVYNAVQPISDEQLASMSEEAKKWTLGGSHLKPLNLRVLDDFDVYSLNIGRADGYNSIKPTYVNP